MSNTASFIECRPINVSSSGDTVLVDISARVAAKSGDLKTEVKERLRIHVYNYMINSAGAVTATFKSGSTSISGPISMAVAGNTINPNGEKRPLMVCSANEDLVIELSGAVQVSGHITYEIK